MGAFATRAPPASARVQVTAHQASKLSANGQDLGGEMLFGTRIGFSGTPSSLLPLEMGECVFQQGDDARMLRALTDPAVVSKHDVHAHGSHRARAPTACCALFSTEARALWVLQVRDLTI